MATPSTFRACVIIALFLALVPAASAQYSGGNGTANDPYQIATAADLIALGETPEDYGKHFILTADIDLDPNLPGRKVFDKAVIAPDTDPDRNGFQGISFTGVFDGNSHKISHLTISGVSYLGLFGGILGYPGMISDLGLETVDVNGVGDYVGGLVGHNDGTLTQCYSSGSVNGEWCVGGLVGTNAGSISSSYSNGSVSGTGYDVGGLVGYNGDGSISSSYSNGSVSGTGNNVGGLVGDIWYGQIVACYNTSSVSGTGDCVGGLAGRNFRGSISSSYSIGSVSGTGDRVGGLVGYNNDGEGSSISSSYSTGSVSGTGDSVGGLVGMNYGNIATSYSTGAVSGDSNVGGLVGNGDPSRVARSVWDTRASGLSGSAGGVGLTTTEMMDPYMLGLNGFANDPHWVLDAGQDYPRLAWERTPGNTIPEPNIGWLRGRGTQDAPYRIDTTDQLILLSKASVMWDKYFVLDADIDLDPRLRNGRVFGQAPIRVFTGVFDGNGHTISNLTIVGKSYLGLFGRVESGAEIRSVGLVEINITGSGDYVGGLVGYNDNGGSISSSYSIGSVSGTGDYVGGLVGRNGSWSAPSSSVAHCYSIGSVSGDKYVGGLVGYNDWGSIIAASYSSGSVSGNSSVGGLVGTNADSITYSYSTGVVSGTGNSVGGFVGWNQGSISSSYSTGAVSGTGDSVGGLVGMNYGNIATSYSTGAVSGDSNVGGLVGNGDPSRVARSVWDTQTSGLSWSAGGVGLTTTEMVDPYMLGLNGFANDPSWTLDAGRDYPRLAWQGTAGQVIPEPIVDWLDGQGTEEKPYRVDVADQLILLPRASALWDRHFVLGADIDLDPNLPGRQVFSQPVIQGFSGVFDGNDHTISHLTITGDSYLGLFGRLVSATVSNLTLEAVDVNGTGDYVGGLAGYNDGTLVRCNSTGVVNGTDEVGGLVGYNDGTLTRCNSTGVVDGNDEVGGLVGSNDGTLTRCNSTGVVDGNDNVGGLVGSNGGTLTQCNSTGVVDGNDAVGGLAGYNAIWSSVSYSYSTGSVSGNDSVGGLVGHNSGNYDKWPGASITASYSSSSVSGTGNSVGGLVGSSGSPFYGGGSITSSYSSGSVSGTGNSVGGLVGSSVGGSILSSFWDIQTSTTLNGVGYYFYADTDEVIGRTTAEMQTAETFLEAGWDSVGEAANGTADIWAEPEGGGYPILWWQLPEGYGLPDFSGGTGEHDDPYGISRADELNRIGHNPRLMKCYFKLVENVDLSGLQFYPIGSGEFPYMGVFDGNGHTVSHLTVVGGDNSGMFAYLAAEAEVRNLGVVDVNITGYGDVGGLAGYNAGSIVACHSEGFVSGIGWYGYFGGLTGYNEGSIVGCHSDGLVSGTGDVGGLVGYNWGSVVQSYSSASVDGEGDVGGLVGYGYVEDVLACFWDTETSGQTTSAGGTGKSTTEMQTAGTFLDAGWDFVGETANGTEDIWWILEGQDYPRLWWELDENEEPNP